MTLTPIMQNSILAALRNGLGLTNACKGLHLDPKQVSEYIKTNEQFETQCRQQLIAGYQTLVVAMNDSSHKKAWDRWKASRSNLDVLVTGLNLWESFSLAKDWSFEKFTMCIRDCKSVPETATAMGLTEREIWENIYQDAKLMQWLMQNGYPV